MWPLKRFNLALPLFLAGLFVVTPSLADFNAVSAQPSNVFVSTSTLVTFVADIQPNPKLIKTGVRLLQDVNGVLTVAGTLYDDGTHGDATANDNKYTNQLTVNKASVGSINYRASAAYAGVAQREQSSVFSVAIIPPVNVTITPGQTELFINQGQTASTAFTLAIQNQTGQTAFLVAAETTNPLTGLGIISDYPNGGWVTSNANQAYLIQNTFQAQTVGDYTVTVTTELTVGGTVKTADTNLLVHVLPSTGDAGTINLSSNPSGLEANKATNVQFAASFNGGLQAPSSASVDEVDAGGTVLTANIGALLDNGSNGDLLANDGIYSGTIAITTGNAGANRYFRANGHFSGGAADIQSAVYELQVIPYDVGFEPGNTSSIVNGTAGVSSTEKLYCDQVMVIFNPGTPFAEIDAAAASVNGTVAAAEPALDAYQFSIPCNGAGGVQAAIAILVQNPNVKSASANTLVPVSEVTPNDSSWAVQYGPAKVRADEAWVIARGGTSIAIVDTGVNYNHPDLAGKVVNGYDYVNNDADAMDDHSHGSHCAGIAAANSNNGQGIAGIAWNSPILAVKVCNASGSCPGSAIASGILYAQSRAKIISMSLGGTSINPLIQTAVANAVANDNLIVAAAGNANSSTPSYPCAYPGVLCVGSTTSTDAKSSFSNWGAHVDIAAPGSSIYSTVLGTGYAYLSGTSMATPLVAGVAGLVWSNFPSWTAAQVQARLIATATPLPGLQIGPRVDAFDALFNGNFEDGLNGWNVTGTGSAVSALGPITPTRDTNMGMASTGPDSAVSQSDLWQSFTVQPGVSNIPVRFSYALITEEYPEWVGSIYNDFLTVDIQKPDGTTQQLAYESVNSSAFSLIGGIDFPGGDSTTGWTGWKNVTLNVPITAGPGTYRIHVSDQGDGIYDTNMVVDNIRFK